MPWSIWLVTDCVLEIFLDFRRLRSSMFMKSMFPPKFSWYVWSIVDAAVLEEAGEHAVHDGGADLALDVVADDRHAGGPELLGPLGVGGDEHRDGVDEGHAGVEAGLGVVALGVLGADGEVGHEHVGLGVAQHLGDVDRLGRALLGDLAVELAEAVEGRAPHAPRRRGGAPRRSGSCC